MAMAMRSPAVGTAVGSGQDAGVWAHRLEAACLVMVVGVVGIYATNTALHGDAKYGLAFVLVASASIALKMGRSSRHG